MRDYLDMLYPIGYIYVTTKKNTKLPQIGIWKYIGKEITIIGIAYYYVRVS